MSGAAGSLQHVTSVGGEGIILSCKLGRTPLSKKQIKKKSPVSLKKNVWVKEIINRDLDARGTRCLQKTLISIFVRRKPYFPSFFMNYQR